MFFKLLLTFALCLHAMIVAQTPESIYTIQTISTDDIFGEGWKYKDLKDRARSKKVRVKPKFDSKDPQGVFFSFDKKEESEVKKPKKSKKDKIEGYEVRFLLESTAARFYQTMVLMAEVGSVNLLMLGKRADNLYAPRHLMMEIEYAGEVYTLEVPSFLRQVKRRNGDVASALRLNKIEFPGDLNISVKKPSQTVNFYVQFGSSTARNYKGQVYPFKAFGTLPFKRGGAFERVELAVVENLVKVTLPSSHHSDGVLVQEIQFKSKKKAKFFKKQLESLQKHGAVALLVIDPMPYEHQSINSKDLILMFSKSGEDSLFRWPDFRKAIKNGEETIKAVYQVKDTELQKAKGPNYLEQILPACSQLWSKVKGFSFKKK